MKRVRDYRAKHIRLYFWKWDFWWFRIFGVGLHFMRRTNGRWEMRLLK